VRISVLVKPIEELSIMPAFLYQKTTAVGLPYIDNDPGTEAHYQPFDVPERTYELFKLNSLKLVIGPMHAENLANYNRIAVSQPLTAGIDLNYRFRPRRIGKVDGAVCRRPTIATNDHKGTP
jgi:hypothetical protein